MYDFSRCKLCASYAASPAYRLAKATIYRCAACDFHFIDHLDVLASGPADHGMALLDEKARTYIEGRLADHGVQLRRHMRLVKTYVPLVGAHCLDIGAGAGLFAHLLREEGAVVQGIEPQGIFREFAQWKFGIVLSGETIEAPCWQQDGAGLFDVVTLWDVLEHVNFPAELVQHAYQLIKPGGWLFLDTPRRDGLYYRLSEWSYRLSGGTNALFLQSLYSPMPFRHKQIFTRRQLVQLLEKTGFTLVRVQSSPLKPQNKMVLVCSKPLSQAAVIH